MNLSQETLDLIAKLAQESGKTEEELIEQLVKHLDEERHSQFVPGTGHIRVKCSHPRCFETTPRKADGRD
jgi:hypothetical protein